MCFANIDQIHIEIDLKQTKTNYFVFLLFSRATIAKVYSYWSSGARKGRMNGHTPATLDPSITHSVLMNSYSAANHDIHTLAARNGELFCFFFYFFNL